jgi:predicted double-glycine peptidase
MNHDSKSVEQLILNNLNGKAKDPPQLMSEIIKDNLNVSEADINVAMWSLIAKSELLLKAGCQLQKV